MEATGNISFEKKNANRAVCSVKMVMALLCFSLIVSGPYGSLPCLWLGAKTAAAAPGDSQGTGSTDTAADDTPSQQDIADFASEYDKDGDGEADEPDAEEADEATDEGESEQGDDDGDNEDDRDDYRDGQDNLNEDDDSGDVAESREDIDRESSPDYRVSGYKRYYSDKRLRRLGDFSGLTPLIEREERLLFEN